MSKSRDSLKISIVTPCYNSEAFLEQTIQSILTQNDPNLEYIVVDGGSSDETLAIIRRHAAQLAYWMSEPDEGMYDAIQKGFEHSTGEIMAYLNSDDQYLPWTLATVRDIFTALPHIDWISSLRPLILNEDGAVCDGAALQGFHKKSYMRGENHLGWGRVNIGFIQQESTFWRRSLWERAGGSLKTDLKLAGDMELWTRFYQYADLLGVRVPLAAFRVHGKQLSNMQAAAYDEEAREVLHQYGAKHSRLGDQLRMVTTKYRPPAKRLWARLGLMYKADIGVYNHKKQTWVTKPVYI